MFILKRIVLFAFFLSATLTSVAQTHNFLSYSVEKGLPQSQIYAMIEDSKGYLWLGTQGGGLSRFDGKNFTNFGTRQGLAGDNIFAVFEDSRKRIWVGTKNGISVLKNGEIQTIEPRGMRVNCFFEKENQIFAGTNKGLFVLQDSIFEYLPAKDDHSWGAVFVLKNWGKDNTFVGTTKGVFDITAKKIIKKNTGEVRDIEILKPGEKIIATYGNGLWLARSDSLINLNSQFNFSAKIIHHILPISEEEIWLATQGEGAIRLNFKTGEKLILNDRNGLETNHARRVIKDRYDNIWIATSKGLYRYLGERFVHFDRDNDLRGGLVYSVLERQNGQIWIGEASRGIARFDSTGITHFGRDSGFLNTKCKALFEDSNGRMWIGTEGEGLGLFEADSFRVFTTKNGLPSNWIRDIAEDSTGTIWLATSEGTIPVFLTDSTYSEEISISLNESSDTLVSLQKTVRKIIVEELIRTGNTFMLLHDGNRIWFGSQSGRIGHINPIKRRMDYLPERLNAPITSMREDSSGYLWISTQGKGIFYINLNEDSLSIQPLRFEEKPLPKNIYLLNLDQENNLWAGTNRGVDKITLNESRQPISLQSYGKSEGFVGIETCRNAAISDRNGHLWFGTVNGLTKYKPGTFAPKPKPPSLFFTGVNLNYKSLKDGEFSNYVDSDFNLKNGLKLPYNKNRPGFEFAAVHLGQADKLRFQTKLTGNDSEWSPPSEQQQIYYPNLQPGDYQFDVRVCVEGTDNCSVMTTPIWTILPPFWQTWWFRFFAFSILAAVVFLIFRSRLKAIERKAKATEERLELQNQMLRLEQQALQLQMNPHFIFNALNSIQSLVVSGDSANARLQLNKFANLMRGILNNSRAERITLEEEISTLRKYLELERMNRNAHFEFEINLPENIPADDLEIPPMLIQPFVENAMIHGVSHLPKGEGIITVNFEFDEQILTCSVTDNGIGRKAAAQKTKKPNHRSIAIQVTRERLEFLAKNKTDLKVFEIEDLVTEAGKVLGTKVILKIFV